MDDKKKWNQESGVDDAKAQRLGSGLAKSAADNPVSNAYAWLKKQVSDKKPPPDDEG